MESIKVTTEISLDKIASLLVCGFEGGVNYWLRIDGYTRPAKPVAHLEGMGDEIFKHVDYPLCEGGEVLCLDIEDDRKPLTLDLAAIKRGLELMPTKSPRQWGRVIADDTDADTGDAFIQCCLLGEVRYG